jgi:hypothetical protein
MELFEVAVYECGVRRRSQAFGGPVDAVSNGFDPGHGGGDRCEALQEEAVTAPTSRTSPPWWVAIRVIQR